MGSVVKITICEETITLASIVFTLSFCLNLVAGKNLPYKGSPSARAKPYPTPVEMEDTEDNNGKRGPFVFRTKRTLSGEGDLNGGKLNNDKGGKIIIHGNACNNELTGFKEIIIHGEKC